MRFVALGLALLVLGGCSSSVQSLPPGGPDDVFDTARSSSLAPDSFTDGITRESCGEFSLGQMQPVPTDAAACLLDAVATRDAELAVTYPTTEGDPIVVFYRTTSTSDAITAFTDTEFDNFGAAEWHESTCPAGFDFSLERRC